MSLNQHPYYRYSSYLKEKYAAPAYRVSVDAGFSCPNRESDRSRGGCRFCDAYGSRAVYQKDSLNLEKQVQAGLRYLKRRYKARVFLLYLQAFSNTFGKVTELKRIYDACLQLGPFREMIVATRPDCVNADVAELLASYARDDFDVWVELGLQSASNNTLERLRRGHSVEDFARAFNLLRSRGIKLVVHLIFGLPGENRADVDRTMDYVAALNPEGVKIHNLYMTEGASLYEEFLCGELTVLSSPRHLEYTIRALERLSPETVIMRLTGDASKQKRVVPRFWEKAFFLNRLGNEMKRRKTCQGMRYRGAQAEGKEMIGEKNRFKEEVPSANQ